MTRAPLAILVLVSCPFLHAQDGDADTRPVSWVRLVPNLLNDQARMWTAPKYLVRKRNWLPVVALLGATAALIETDNRTASYFRTTNTFQGFNSVFTGKATAIGIGATPVALFALGAIDKSSYGRHTAILAGEALLDAEILTTVMKDIDRRIRPAAYPAGSNFPDSWFNSQGSWIRGNGSFPSGHAIGAFSVATIIARRYPRKKWVPYVAYGLSAAVGFSRMTLSAHFASDVFVGGVLGYAVSRFVVLHQ